MRENKISLNEQQQQDPILLNHAQLITQPSREVACAFRGFLNKFYNFENTHPYEILRCTKSQNSADPKYTAAEASNHIYHNMFKLLW